MKLRHSFYHYKDGRPKTESIDEKITNIYTFVDGYLKAHSGCRMVDDAQSKIDRMFILPF
jgi:hypothetical protein